MNYYQFLIMISMILGLLTGNASSKGCDDTIAFNGGGAGRVALNVSTHTAKGVSCGDCHEGRGFSFALFDQKIGSNTITMRKMEMGSSCGHCHNGRDAFSTTNNLNCARCHHKS